jgi:drug/metabolite transporter (DMT)-like permease
MGKSAFSHLWPGAPLAFASALLFGITAPLAKLLLAAFDPQALAGTLYLGAGLGLAAYALVRRALGAPSAEAPLRRADAPWLAAIVLTGGVAAPLALMQGLQFTGAANASLLLNLEGLATMAIAWVAFRENVDARLLAGAAAILAGATLLSWRGGGVSLESGALLVAGACLAWGVDNNLTRKLSSADPVSIAAIKGVVAGTVNVAAAWFWRGAAPPAPSSVGLAALLGFFGIGVSLVLFILALRHLGTARTGAYFSLAPFIGALAAIGLLHEAPTLRLGLAGLLMAAGVWMHLSERHEHEHEHEALEHDHAHVHDEHHQHGHDGPVAEPHAHWHRHARLIHGHPHYPDLHHRHSH